MKHIISVLLFFTVILVYLIVKDWEEVFLYFAWLTGYSKDLFDKSNG